jgi:hypothetical protein
VTSVTPGRHIVGYAVRLHCGILKPHAFS